MTNDMYASAKIRPSSSSGQRLRRLDERERRSVVPVDGWSRKSHNEVADLG